MPGENSTRKVPRQPNSLSMRLLPEYSKYKSKKQRVVNTSKRVRSLHRKSGNASRSLEQRLASSRQLAPLTEKLKKYTSKYRKLREKLMAKAPHLSTVDEENEGNESR